MFAQMRWRAEDAAFFQDYAVAHYERMAGAPEREAIRAGEHAYKVVYWVAFFVGDGRLGRLLMRLIP